MQPSTHRTVTTYPPASFAPVPASTPTTPPASQAVLGAGLFTPFHISQTRAEQAESLREAGIKYRGVSQHVGRRAWDVQVWARGKQNYVARYQTAQEAALAYDIAALQLLGPDIKTLNFPLATYAPELKMLSQVSEEHVLELLRFQARHSTGQVAYLGVHRHTSGRFEARLGSSAVPEKEMLAGKKYMYLGLYATAWEAALAYDKAVIELQCPNSITNQQLVTYLQLIPTEPNTPVTSVSSGQAGVAHIDDVKDLMDWLESDRDNSELGL